MRENQNKESLENRNLERVTRRRQTQPICMDKRRGRTRPSIGGWVVQ
jgi:hypothetical protein